jgi:hypothetical protein
MEEYDVGSSGASTSSGFSERRSASSQSSRYHQSPGSSSSSRSHSCSGKVSPHVKRYSTAPKNASPTVYSPNYGQTASYSPTPLSASAPPAMANVPRYYSPPNDYYRRYPQTQWLGTTASPELIELPAEPKSPDALDLSVSKPKFDSYKVVSSATPSPAPVQSEPYQGHAHINTFDNNYYYKKHLHVNPNYPGMINLTSTFLECCNVIFSTDSRRISRIGN